MQAQILAKTGSAHIERFVSPRLSDVLFGTKKSAFESFAIVPSNVHAVECAFLFADMQQPFVVIFGPSGWGKSHLLEAVANKLSETYNGQRIQTITASEFVAAPHRTEASLPLLLDDVQDLIMKTRSRLPLRLALERRMKARRPTLLCFTGQRMTRQMQAFVPMLREWTIATVPEPSKLERANIIRQLASVEAVRLCEDLTSVLAQRLPGNGLTIVGALRRLRSQGNTWVGPRDTIAALGLLHPCIANGSDWDMRDHISDVADRYQFKGLNRHEMVTYTLHRVAGVPEEDVSAYLAISQGQVYSLARQHESRMQRCHDTCLHTERFLKEVVDRLG